MQRYLRKSYRPADQWHLADFAIVRIRNTIPRGHRSVTGHNRFIITTADRAGRFVMRRATVPSLLCRSFVTDV
jgi:hypothetical protein